MSDDPFADFAEAMKQAQNTQEAAGTPLLDAALGAAPHPTQITSVKEAAEIVLRADAEAKAARLRKRAAEAFILAIANNEREVGYALGDIEVNIEEVEQLSFDGGKWLADGNQTHNLVEINATIPPAKLRNLPLHAFPELGQYVKDKGVKQKVVVKRI